eukprot:CAMPEP_0119569200 /NCGR_PEP_ID=MMETSP1352-20130426/40995_1 /TAXON_ID=265584 /ORGANISM="Stauroneis constricta, Strain CCMP1120" /LENGTH=154 /DNA_ID=CAMNT_0007618715 /DNA_START=123 /DNA_END=584 /DNA_ORIENTATION=+
MALAVAMMPLTLVDAANNYYNQQDGDYGSASVYVKNCDDSIVKVTSASILCDSPYTYYYGNGAHRNSAYCDYGDKATIDVCFTVTEDLSSSLDEIYITFGVYSALNSDDELLYSIRAGQLCSGIVGNNYCTSAGNYCFQLKKTFDTPNGGSSEA